MLISVARMCASRVGSSSSSARRNLTRFSSSSSSRYTGRKRCLCMARERTASTALMRMPLAADVLDCGRGIWSWVACLR